MQSLDRKHPVGSLLVRETRTENARARGDGPLAAGTVKLLLDGQQRITSLYGLIRGRPPRFFDGNARAFAGLSFHLDDEGPRQGPGRGRSNFASARTRRSIRPTAGSRPRIRRQQPQPPGDLAVGLAPAGRVADPLEQEPQVRRVHLQRARRPRPGAARRG